MNPSKDIDSKFRYVIIASKRAKQLLKGSRPKIKSKSKNLIRVAQEEVKRGYIEYELVSPKKTEPLEIEEEALIGEDLVSAVETMAEKRNEGDDVLSGLLSLAMKEEQGRDEDEDEDQDEDEDEGFDDDDEPGPDDEVDDEDFDSDDDDKDD